jgi:O-antigen ligase
VIARALAKPPDAQFIYRWLQLALFLEYSRPASFFPVLNIPFFYSAVPLLLFFVSLFAPGLRKPKEALADPQAKWIFMMLGLLFLSMVIFGSYAVAPFTGVLGYVMLFSVIVRVCTTWERVRGVLVALLAAHLFLLAMNPIVLLDPTKRHYIMGATFLGDGNDFGLSLCLLFPCALWLAQTAKGWRKILGFATVVVILYALVAGQSRGATLGIGAVFLFLWLQSKKKTLGIVLIAVVAVGVLALAPAAYFNRMGTIGDTTEGSAAGRVNAWKAGIGMGANSPVVGVGAGHFGPRWGKTAHSTYVLAFGELGLPGFIVVLGLVIGNFRLTNSLRKRVQATVPEAAPDPARSATGSARPAAAAAALPVAKRAGKQKTADPATPVHPNTVVGRSLLMLTAALIGFAVAGAFLSATYYPHLYILGGIMMAARAIAVRETGVALVEGDKKRTFRARPGAAAKAGAGSATPVEAGKPTPRPS